MVHANDGELWRQKQNSEDFNELKGSNFLFQDLYILWNDHNKSSNDLFLSEKQKVQNSIYRMLPFMQEKENNKILLCICICSFLQKETQKDKPETDENGCPS